MLKCVLMCMLIIIFNLLVIHELFVYVGVDALAIATYVDIKERHEIARVLLCGSASFTCSKSETCKLCYNEILCSLTTPLDKLYGMYRCSGSLGWAMPQRNKLQATRVTSTNGKSLEYETGPLALTLEHIADAYTKVTNPPV
jgi:hypothetical protein